MKKINILSWKWNTSWVEVFWNKKDLEVIGKIEIWGGRGNKLGVIKLIF